VCDSIGITPKPNNGTLRLPLKPVGLHSDDNAPGIETPDDPPLVNTVVATRPVISTAAPTASSSTQNNDALKATISSPEPPISPETPTPPAPPAIPNSPSIPEAPTTGDEPGEASKKPGWLTWITDALDAAKKKLSNLFNKDSPQT
jgi:hypothetical protein